MDFRIRALYYLVDVGADAPEDSADRLLSLGLKPEHMTTYDKRPGIRRWENTAERELFVIATDFLDKHQSRIPVDTLAIKVETISDPTLREYATALTRNLRGQTGDGADIPEVYANILQTYREFLLWDTFTQVANDVLRAGEDPQKAEQIIVHYLEKVEETKRGNQQMIYTFGSTSGQHVMDYLEREGDDQAGLGVPTGMLPFDEETGGVKPGEVLGICGGTKRGKTSKCGSIAANAYLLGKNVACAGKEMYGSSLRRRMEAGMLLAEVRGGRVYRKKSGCADGLLKAMERGTLPDHLKQKFFDLQQHFSDEEENDHRLWIFEPGSYSNLKELSTLVGYTKRRHGLDLLWVDSLNIQTVGGRPDERHDLSQGSIVLALKELAIAHNIAVITDLQERPQTVDKRTAQKEEFVMFSTSITQRLDHLLRIWMPPGKPNIREIQHHAARSSGLVDPFLLYFWESEMVFEPAPKDALNDAPGDRSWGQAEIDEDDTL